MEKSNGNVCIMSFDNGQGLSEKISPFDTFAQIIEGNAELIIDGNTISIETGQSIVIPAHSSSLIKPNGRFKMIMTVIMNT
jgi:quercetin dioxygenase-like cupin family protein